ncbi:MAG: hypothetical protein J4215_05220 [Candidatus Diapherotrites archaeon]|uniref:Uncharacterized protein n=1 Tax=Candidatus Iainarchaeum sp. TaxID=3101447 RepID=A0A8T4L5Y9_9ARCH|nr:hypothetical protein [Candidatus Diapherotrites archaeon]
MAEEEMSVRKQKKPKTKTATRGRPSTARQIRKTVNTVKWRMNDYAKKQIRERQPVGPMFIPTNAIPVPKIIQSEQFRIGFAAQLIRSGVISKKSFRLQLQKSCSPQQFKKIWAKLESALNPKRA